MERLKIKNFLTLKNIDIETADLNVLIGEQASGKSIILKLLHFFNNSRGRFIMEVIREEEGVRKYKGLLEKKFNEYFDLYDLSGVQKKYNIEYIYSDINIKIEGKGNKIKITLNKNLKNNINLIKKNYIKFKSDKKAKFLFDNEFYALDKLTRYIHRANRYNNMFHGSIFIPSSRSFFSILESNIFSFLKESINMDILIKEFGSTYEMARDLYYDIFIKELDIFKLERKNDRLIKKLLNDQKDIIKGEYIRKGRKEFIVSENVNVKLSKASSGQQEALPLFIVMLVFAIFKAKGLSFGIKGRKVFFIEEPEAHLFPLAQRKIMQSMAAIVSEAKHRIFIGTHSPYLISELNTIILYNLVKNKINNKSEYNLPDLDIDKIKVYTIANGIAEDIYNKKERIIEADIIDKVAVESDDVYNDLLNYLEG